MVQYPPGLMKKITRDRERRTSNCIRLTIDTAYENGRVVHGKSTGKLGLAVNISRIIESYLDFYEDLSDSDEIEEIPNLCVCSCVIL